MCDPNGGQCVLPLHLVWAGVALTGLALGAFSFLAAVRPSADLPLIISGISLLIGPTTGVVGVLLHQRATVSQRGEKT